VFVFVDTRGGGGGGDPSLENSVGLSMLWEGRGG
jgi:hypothetical protein